MKISKSIRPAVYLMFSVPGFIMLFSELEPFASIGIEMIGAGITFIILYAAIDQYDEGKEREQFKFLVDLQSESAAQMQQHLSKQINQGIATLRNENQKSSETPSDVPFEQKAATLSPEQVILLLGAGLMLLFVAVRKIRF